MYEGYLVIETDKAHPGLVRILETATLPSGERTERRQGKGPRVRYVARFNDLSAGHMHAQGALRRGVVDVEAGLYRCDPIDAVAAVEASALGHRTAYLDPEIADDPRLAAAVAARGRHRRVLNQIWRGVGIAAVLFLLVKVLLGF